MARLLRIGLSISSCPCASIRPFLITNRTRSNLSGKGQLIDIDLESDGDFEVMDMRRLEDVIHGIIVKRAAPDWLPFRPGSSYWVPPRNRPSGVVDIIRKLASPLSEDEAMSLSSSRGWPSSAFFIEASAPTHPVLEGGEVEVKVHVNSDDED
ncbi:uncharacterized protein LOC124921202 [Impatiens glandulifera]|uniref:uncharacterized protein LOC124921202 n=1 Tax=Impatiens glandulifera TaxID=253017 RepID=UPI001FB1324E|nr:uncharacterized protein LOC124921202 [Impatiens glandulifera]XP_047317787.1 uncharacterized protein LOC124921202 [Impatiens glandulifera]